MPLAACGHGNQVSLGRCWDCWLAHLRDIGQGDRADRLIEHKRQHDEGRFDFKRLVDGMVAMYAEELTLQADDDPDGTRPPRLALPLPDGRAEL